MTVKSDVDFDFPNQLVDVQSVVQTVQRSDVSDSVSEVLYSLLSSFRRVRSFKANRFHTPFETGESCRMRLTEILVINSISLFHLSAIRVANSGTNVG